MHRKTIQYASITIPDFLCVLGRIWTSSAFILGFVCTLALPAQADSIAITYSLTGIGTVQSATDTTLTLLGQFSGSVLSGNPSLDRTCMGLRHCLVI